MSNPKKIELEKLKIELEKVEINKSRKRLEIIQEIEIKTELEIKLEIEREIEMEKLKKLEILEKLAGEELEKLARERQKTRKNLKQGAAMQI